VVVPLEDNRERSLSACESKSSETSIPEVDAVEVNRKRYTAVAEEYLAVKGEHPHSLVLQRSKSREFY
jgi:hypothetical protein